MLFQRVKSLDGTVATAQRGDLKRNLSAFDLTMLGVGGIIGTGIFVLTAVGAQKAGPALILSFLACALVCGLVALAFAELSAMVPASGSSYTYTYTIFGELLAWLVGFALILEYAFAASVVSIGWSGYFTALLKGWGIVLPFALVNAPHEGGIVNLPAIFISLTMMVMLIIGTKESARLTTFLVAIKIFALSLFILFALPAFNAANVHFDDFKQFAPNGMGGAGIGVIGAAATIFFAFVGFDAVSTAAEETKNPNRDVPIGLVASLGVCTIFYIVVALAAVGAVDYRELYPNGTPLKEPLVFILNKLGHGKAGAIVAAAAVIAMPSVVMMMMYGQSRIFFAMSRDGLLPRGFGKLHPKFQTPYIITLVTGFFCAVIGGFMKIDEVADVSNSGTLFAYAVVIAGVLYLRVKRPELPRPFKCPAVWIVGPLAILGCLFFFIFGLAPLVHKVFVFWMVIGIIIYYAYSYRASPLGKVAQPAE
jgi:basic amino acid/polyamine antiporter, APA family